MQFGLTDLPGSEKNPTGYTESNLFVAMTGNGHHHYQSDMNSPLAPSLSVSQPVSPLAGLINRRLLRSLAGFITIYGRKEQTD